MRIQHSANARTSKEVSESIEDILASIPEDFLQHVIETISVPRHYSMEKANNERIGRWIRHQFETLGFQVSCHGRFKNTVALPTTPLASSTLLAAAHYDTVPGSPGADDNGSGIAVLLACARALSVYQIPTSTIFITAITPFLACQYSCTHVDRYGRIPEYTLSQLLGYAGYFGLCIYEAGRPVTSQSNCPS